MVTVVEERKTNVSAELIVEENSMLDASMLDQIPEFIREEIDEDRRKPQLDAKPMLPATSIEVLRSNEITIPPSSVRQERTTGSEKFAPESPPADELETLWPGVHHHNDMHNDLIPASKRQPSFYMMLGFMAGACISLLGVWSYSAVSTTIANSGGKQILVAGASTKANDQQSSNDQQIEAKSIDPNATLVPISSTYEVKTGDTLVMIAMKNYKKVTPRLLDEIVKANGMKSAHVLNLGQKINLPNYKPQSSAIAATSSGQVH
jgi:LysM repeat protein